MHYSTVQYLVLVVAVQPLVDERQSEPLMSIVRKLVTFDMKLLFVVVVLVPMIQRKGVIVKWNM